ncbi:cobalamin biosynthesis protein [Kushneria aurantia]|uniref:Cobalamin biosynthesis protein n=1 Tax=Kushneria aurantia TaxID=504092 RepID=A0ABV6G4F4_9GAMM|nr:cobalamin biosynthesis protein [Kushneria aurantia]
MTPTIEAVGIAVGVGCRRHCPPEVLATLVSAALEGAGLSVDDVSLLASLVDKADTPAIVALAERHGWPLQTLPAAQLALYEHRLSHKSEAARRVHGTPGVAEAAALASLEQQGGSARLLLPRRHNRWATVAIATAG